MRRAGITVCILFSSVWLAACSQRPVSLDRGRASVSSSAGNFLRVGAAAVELESDDSMVIAGSIHPVRLKGQEGQLRVVAVALATSTDKPLVIVACDVLMLTRDLLDPVVDEIESSLGIDRERILINTTHTHHAPSTVTVHGYGRDEVFCQRLQQGIIKAVRQAQGQLADAGPSRFCFRLGQEDTVGRNSRLLLSDNTIYWIGPRDDAVRPTGPFDSDLPVLAFYSHSDCLEALIFNHSTHTIGIRTKGRSPSFYGLAAQELEQELGGTVCFLEGASGSTHKLGMPTGEAVIRIKDAVRRALQRAEPRPVTRLLAIKKPFTFRVRHFDEETEDAQVSAYCRKRVPDYADSVIEVFRKQRAVLAPKQGEQRTTWVQVMCIGDVAIVGVPAEFFTVLGLEIKRRSPFRYTYIAELANDWIGYLPDREAFDYGGYQTWTGLHCVAEPGTGEAMVEQVLRLLDTLHPSSN